MRIESLGDAIAWLIVGGVVLFVAGIVIHTILFHARKKMEQKEEQERKERAKAIPGRIPDLKEMEAEMAELRRTGTYVRADANTK